MTISLRIEGAINLIYTILLLKSSWADFQSNELEMKSSSGFEDQTLEIH